VQKQSRQYWAYTWYPGVAQISGASNNNLGQQVSTGTRPRKIPPLNNASTYSAPATIISVLTFRGPRAHGQQCHQVNFRAREEPSLSVPIGFAGMTENRQDRTNVATAVTQKGALSDRGSTSLPIISQKRCRYFLLRFVRLQFLACTTVRVPKGEPSSAQRHFDNRAADCNVTPRRLLNCMSKDHWSMTFECASVSL
jgi:hypothetical protein